MIFRYFSLLSRRHALSIRPFCFPCSSPASLCLPGSGSVHFPILPTIPAQIRYFTSTLTQQSLNKDVNASASSSVPSPPSLHYTDHPIVKSFIDRYQIPPYSSVAGSSSSRNLRLSWIRIPDETLHRLKSECIDYLDRLKIEREAARQNARKCSKSPEAQAQAERLRLRDESKRLCSDCLALRLFIELIKEVQLRREGRDSQKKARLRKKQMKLKSANHNDNENENENENDAANQEQAQQNGEAAVAVASKGRVRVIMDVEERIERAKQRIREIDQQIERLQTRLNQAQEATRLPSDASGREALARQQEIVDLAQNIVTLGRKKSRNINFITTAVTGMKRAQADKSNEESAEKSIQAPVKAQSARIGPAGFLHMHLRNLEYKTIQYATEVLREELSFASVCKQALNQLQAELLACVDRAGKLDAFVLGQYLHLVTPHIGLYSPQQPQPYMLTLESLTKSIRLSLDDPQPLPAPRIPIHTRRREEKRVEWRKQKWDKFLTFVDKVNQTKVKLWGTTELPEQIHRFTANFIPQLVSYFSMRSLPSLLIYESMEDNAEPRYELIFYDVDIRLMQTVCQSIAMALKNAGMQGIESVGPESFLTIDSEAGSDDGLITKKRIKFIRTRARNSAPQSVARSQIAQDTQNETNQVGSESDPSAEVPSMPVNSSLSVPSSRSNPLDSIPRGVNVTHLGLSIECSVLSEAVATRNDEDYLLMDLGDISIQAFASSSSEKFQKYLEYISSTSHPVPIDKLAQLKPNAINRFNVVVNA